MLLVSRRNHHQVLNFVYYQQQQQQQWTPVLSSMMQWWSLLLVWKASTTTTLLAFGGPPRSFPFHQQQHHHHEQSCDRLMTSAVRCDPISILWKSPFTTFKQRFQPKLKSTSILLGMNGGSIDGNNVGRSMKTPKWLQSTIGTRLFSSSSTSSSTLVSEKFIGQEVKEEELDPVATAATAAVSGSSIVSTGVTILADHNDFITPDRDPRQYRAILLPNNLRVLLVSDQMTPGSIGIEAASVHVQAGHFDDTLPGLAHFHEHMLFLGTKKYPNEDDYESFLSQYGGSSNAYTDMEDTNYYFSVTTEAGPETSDALKGALDRFAQFFIAPTFDTDAVDRELRAIDSEYRNGKTSDSWRNFQILKSLADPRHPFHKFGCGNYETLSEKGIPHLLNELETFWKTYYQTYNLRLAVVGHASLDALQQTVLETFGQLPYSDGSPRRVVDNVSRLPFTREGAVYGVDAFNADDHLRRFRKIKPLSETRVLKVYFKTPPLEDPSLRKSKPYSAVSHVLGHEGPGSLHALLNEEGFINSLSSGMAIDTSDFSLFQVSISLTPKGLQQQEKVLDLLFQWIGMVRNEDKERLVGYHEELKQIASVNFRFRENGDPSDFCATASELLFDEMTDVSRILTSSSDTADFDPVVADAFLNRLRPQNCMITLVSSDIDDTLGDNWITEKWYGAKYQEEMISQEKLSAWDNAAKDHDTRLRLPELNQYIPTDFSLRCDQSKGTNGCTPVSTAAVVPPAADDVDVIPKILTDNASIRLWHKMDHYWRVPKTIIKVALLSPSIYSTPRTMTLNRIFQKMLNDDLNSYVYDASLAGCNYRVGCTPLGYRISLRGYSEKIPFLLNTLTSRILSLIEEMKSNNKPALEAKFQKAKEALLRETKNYRLDPPYEVASYNARLLMEESVWYLDNYVDVMEGAEAKRHPLTMNDCAFAAEECLTGRIKCEAICMGNINVQESDQVVDVLNERFLSNSRLLSEVEIPRFRSMKLPTQEEATQIFGPAVATSDRVIPVVYQELAYTDTEENNSVEIILQAGSEFELGYDGIAILNLIAHIAYNSAFNQLRTKEQLGYIVSAHVRNSMGGAWSLSLVVQSSVALPEQLERRCESWLEQFRIELEEMSPSSYAQEASAVVAQLLESETKLSQEVNRVWGEILNTEGLVDRLRTPAFDRLQKLAQQLMIHDDTESSIVDDHHDDNTKYDSLMLQEVHDTTTTTPDLMKRRVLDFFDKHFKVGSPDRRMLSSRVYSHNSKVQYEKSLGQPGVLSTYSDMRYFKQFLSTYPTIPYWRIEQEVDVDDKLSNMNDNTTR